MLTINNAATGSNHCSTYSCANLITDVTRGGTTRSSQREQRLVQKPRTIKTDDWAQEDSRTVNGLIYNVKNGHILNTRRSAIPGTVQ